MANPVTQLLEHINHEVSKLSTTGLSELTKVLDAAEIELTHSLANWKTLGKGTDRFTPQMYRNALIQIRGTLDHIRGSFAENINSILRHGGVLAASLSTKHLITEVTQFSHMFEGSIRPIAIEAASVLAEGKALVWKRFSNSAKRYAGAVGNDIKKQLAIGIVRGETVDQLTTRLAKLGGPKGLVYTQGAPGTPHAKAEYIAEGLFRRYRHYGERLVITETVNAYNSFALEGMTELEREDPGYFKRWDAALDARTCPQCGQYDDLIAKLNENFKGGIDHPPLHPRCRCAVVVWRKEWSEHRHKDDLIAESIPGKEPKGVASIPHRITLPKQKIEKEIKVKPSIKEQKQVFTPVSKNTMEDMKKYFSDLTTDEKDAQAKYGGQWYKHINTALRTGKDHPNEAHAQRIKEAIKHLDSSIQKSKAPHNLQVYRGADHPDFANLKVGDTITDKGFMSTSGDTKVAKSFGDTLFHIEVPKGMHIAPIEGASETELLLPKNTTLKILDVTVEEGKKIIKARVQ